MSTIQIDIVEYDKNNGIEIVIFPKSNRKLKRNLDNSLYYYRHIIDNTFLAFKRWRAIGSRYFKTSITFHTSFLFVLFLFISVSISSRFLIYLHYLKSYK